MIIEVGMSRAYRNLSPIKVVKVALSKAKLQTVLGRLCLRLEYLPLMTPIIKLCSILHGCSSL